MNAHALYNRVVALANQVEPEGGVPGLLHHLIFEGEMERARSAAAPALVLVLEGKLSVRRHGEREIHRAGTALLLPARFPLAIRYEPGADSGRFRALFLEFETGIIARFRAAFPEKPDRPAGDLPLHVPVDIALAEALGHALEALLQPDRHGPVLAQARLIDVLLRLRQQGRLPDLVGAEGASALPLRSFAHLPSGIWPAHGCGGSPG